MELRLKREHRQYDDAYYKPFGDDSNVPCERIRVFKARIFVLLIGKKKDWKGHAP
jgi:hypothetical protein